MYQLNPNDFLFQVTPHEPCRLGQVKVSFERGLEYFSALPHGKEKLHKAHGWSVLQAKKLLTVFKRDEIKFFTIHPYFEVPTIIVRENFSWENFNPAFFHDQAQAEDPLKGIRAVVLSRPNSRNIRGFVRDDSTELFLPKDSCFLGSYEIGSMQSVSHPQLKVHPIINVMKQISSPATPTLHCRVNVHDSEGREDDWFLVNRIYHLAFQQKEGIGIENALSNLIEEVEAAQNFSLLNWIRNNPILHSPAALEDLIKSLEVEPPTARYIRYHWNIHDQDFYPFYYGPLKAQIWWQSRNTINSGKEWLWDLLEHRLPEDEEIIPVNQECAATLFSLAASTIESLSSNAQAWERLTFYCVEKMKQFGIKISDNN
ncbi:MAG: hypothetical protein HYZ63_01260 [Candidatus Andersenbacteria bacterium]|nr:hypothetical protein [Candidatus Andersenbacteria bacterium]